MNNDDVYVSFGFDTMPTLVGLMLILQFIFAPINVVLGFLVNKLTRRYEFQADAVASGLGYNGPLQSALIKLQIGNLVCNREWPAPCLLALLWGILCIPTSCFSVTSTTMPVSFY